MNRKFNHLLGIIVTSALAVMSLGGCKDASADLAPNPELKSLTPNALTWAADETDPKTIEIEGTDLKDAQFILSGLTDFNAELDGTTITVTPKDVNDLDEDIVNILTVAIKGGKSLTATVTQTKPVRVPNLTALTPESLTWGPEEAEAKTIVVDGDYLTGKVLTVTLPESSNFTATVEGDVVTVTPKAANTTETVFEETLTVAVEGGNSLTATLTQAKPAPALTALTPETLTWAADETAAKTIEVAASYLAGAALTVTLPESSNFTATVEGTVVTVAPKAANTGATAFVETLTVSVEGGNSLEATLTQTPPAPALTALTPNALTWAAENADAKTITIEGTNIAGKTITLSELTNFEVEVAGTTVTVTPKSANATYEAVEETLTVSFEGGNSLTATLTQEAKPRPSLTSLTPNSLTWAAAETDSKTVTVAGENLEGATITATVEGDAFRATVEGTTVTVTPVAANEGTADVTATLTVSVADGNSLPATLTQTKPESTGGETITPGWYKVTENKEDWSGTYIFVYDRDKTNQRNWTAVGGQLNRSFVTVDDNGRIDGYYNKKSHAESDAKDMALLNDCIITIAKVDGGYTIMTSAGKYITNNLGTDAATGEPKPTAGTVFSDTEVIGATSIKLVVDDVDTDGNANTTVEIAYTTTSVSFGYFETNNIFNYFPDSAWADKNRITFFEYKE